MNAKLISLGTGTSQPTTTTTATADNSKIQSPRVCENPLHDERHRNEAQLQNSYNELLV